jgi:hypothetical protein
MKYNEELKELNNQSKSIVSRIRPLQRKQLNLSEEEARRLEFLEKRLSDLQDQINTVQKEYIKNEKGQEMLDLWEERASLKSSPHISSSETGKRVKFLDEHLKELTDFFTGF